MAVDGLDVFDRLIEREASMLRKPHHRAPAVREYHPFGHAADTANPTLVLYPFHPERLHLILHKVSNSTVRRIETALKVQGPVHLPVSSGIVLLVEDPRIVYHVDGTLSRASVSM